MKVLYDSLEQIMKEEYDRATERFGLYHNTPSEAYGVILEEAEESEEAVIRMKNELAFFWRYVRENDDSKSIDAAKEIMHAALLGACELIQTAAMAYKAQQGYSKIHTWPAKTPRRF